MARKDFVAKMKAFTSLRSMPAVRLFSLLLCMLLLSALVLTACDAGTSGTDSSAAPNADGVVSNGGEQTGDSLYQDAEGNYTLAKLERPEFNFTQKEFRVCVYSNEVQTTYFSEEIGYDLYDTTDSALNEGVRNRNNLVEQEYGVKIVPVIVSDAAAKVRETVQASLDEYDAAMPFMKDCTRLAQDGMLLDLMSFTENGYLHLEAPWWDQNANEVLSIAGRLYFTTGDISIMQKIVSSAVVFNKRLYAEYCADTYGDLYQRVRDHKWTVDVLVEMAKLVASDTDGEAGMSYKDTWGLDGNNAVASTWLLCGNIPLIGKDAQDYPVLLFGETENGIKYAQKLLETFGAGSEDWFINVQTNPTVTGNVWQISADIFGENRSLFMCTSFSGVKKMRNYANMDAFGIVPVPAASEAQEEYYTLSNGYAYGVCIPKGVQDPQFSAYMLDVLACGGKNYITPAYYETALKIRDSSDPESAEMLDQYIFKNTIYDLGDLYDFGGISSMLTGLLSSNSTDVVSRLDSIRSSVIDAIDRCVEIYQSDS